MSGAGYADIEGPHRRFGEAKALVEVEESGPATITVTFTIK